VFGGFVGGDVDVDGVELDQAARLVGDEVAQQALGEAAPGRLQRRGIVALPHRVARLLRLLRDAFGVARTRPVDQAQASIHRLEAMEARKNPLCGVAPPGRGL